MIFKTKDGHGYTAKWNASLSMYEIYDKVAAVPGDNDQHVFNFNPHTDHLVILKNGNTVLGRVVDVVKFCVYLANQYRL